VAQKPKLSDIIPRMVKEISDVLEIERERVNVKATTTEGLGFTGREEGIAAYAVALVEED
jgi:2-C-methyl-D-erythritol 2,4-cyclodiphosphate synthase